MKRNIFIGSIAFLSTLFIVMLFKLATTDIKFDLYNDGKIVCFKDKSCFKLTPIE